MGIAEHLKQGSQNGIDQAYLANKLHTSEREIRRAVNRERAAGKPILSGQTGYFLPREGAEGLQDLKACYAVMAAGLVTRLSVLNALQEEIKKREGATDG